MGHQISMQGVQPDLEKILVVQEWSQPTNLKELRGFLGLSGYYRRFIQGYGKIATPLTALLQKDIPYVWGSTG